MATQPDDRLPEYKPQVPREQRQRDTEPQVGGDASSADPGEQRASVAPKDGSVPAGDDRMEMPRPPVPLTLIIVLIAVAIIVGVGLVMLLPR